MISSPFFILFEFLKRYYVPLDIQAFTPYDLFVCGGIALIMVCGALLSKNARGKITYIFYIISSIACIIATLLFLIVAITLVYNRFGPYTQSRFGWNESNFYAVLFAGLCAIAFIFCGMASRFVKGTPDNDSTLNPRQILVIIMVVSGIAFFTTCLRLASTQVFDCFVLAAILLFEVGSIFFWFYDPLIYTIASLFPRKTKAPLPATPGKTNRFAIIICAHNEEQVVGYLLESIFATNYPYGKYDTYVVCDDCSDDTALIAQRQGAIPLIKENKSSEGKIEALQWAFGILKKKQQKETEYDAYITLNADNLVNENFLTEINYHLNQGHELMQTYHGSKNPDDTVISRCSSMGSWLENAIHEQARTLLNLSANAGGTGLVIRPSLLEEIPWEADCLTEELAFNVKYLLGKKRNCHWVHSAVLYEERPLTLKASFKRRGRRMQGHMATMVTYAPSLFLSSLKTRSFSQFDMAIHLVKPLFVLLSVFFYTVRSIFFLFFPQSVAGATVLVDFPLALMLVLGYFLVQIYALARENYLRYAAWLFLRFLYTCTWFLPLLRSFMKRNESYWVSTYHARALAINEVSEDMQINEVRRKLAGLENLHLLPIGQILFKAGIITFDDLERAVAVQRRRGGYLGNILVDNGAISEETLSFYISIQQSIHETTASDPQRFQWLHLSQILLDAHMITREQLDEALLRQRERGGEIGENMISLGFVSRETLECFLQLQKVINANFLGEEAAADLIENMTSLKTCDYESLERLILNSGLVSDRQLSLAYEHQKDASIDLLDALQDLGFVTRDTLSTIEQAVKVGVVGVVTGERSTDGPLS